MPTKAEDYETKAADAERAGDYGTAAENYFNAYREHLKEGDATKAGQAKTHEVDSLKHLGIDKLKDFARLIVGWALTREDRALKTSASSDVEGPGGSTEIYERAANYRWLAARCYDVAYGIGPGEEERAMYGRMAAVHYDKAAEDLEKSAADEPDTPKDQKEATQNYQLAASLHELAADAFRRAALNFQADHRDDEAKKQEKAKDDRDKAS
jgi:hypothetical protein